MAETSSRAVWPYLLAGIVVAAAAGTGFMLYIPRLAIWWMGSCPPTTTLPECGYAKWMISYWWMLFIALALLLAFGLNRAWARPAGRSPAPDA